MVRSSGVSEYTQLLHTFVATLSETPDLNPVRANRLFRVYDEVVSLSCERVVKIKNGLITGRSTKLDPERLRTRERNDRVDDHRLHGFTVGCDQHEGMSLDGKLGRTDGRERVDHSESVSSAGRDGERLQRGVGAESRVGVLKTKEHVQNHSEMGVDCISYRFQL